MASIDTLFQKTNLEESKRQGKMLFGRMLISLRKSNHIKLYAMLESVEEMDIVDNVLKLTMTDRTSYEMINNKEDLLVLEREVCKLRENTKVELLCNGTKAFDIFDFENRLINEFGKKLTIKRK
jgi:hypothetical protein